jgi:hypothetical protein
MTCLRLTGESCVCESYMPTKANDDGANVSPERPASKKPRYAVLAFLGLTTFMFKQGVI